MASEYGWSRNNILERHTFQQLSKLHKKIIRRQKRKLAVESSLLRAALASLLDKDAARAFNEEIQELLDEYEESVAVTDAQLESMGIEVRK
ncbi:hypothetical protein ES703_104854 [subsurface metagenome]